MILVLYTYVMESKNLIYPSIDIFIFSFIISENNAPWYVIGALIGKVFQKVEISLWKNI